MASAGAWAYNGGLEAKPPAGSKGRGPAQGVTPEAESFLAFELNWNKTVCIKSYHAAVFLL